MAQRHTLIRIAIAGTATLWTVTIASAVTYATSQRLHHVLLAVSILALAATLAMAGYAVARHDIAQAVASSSYERSRALDTQTERLEAAFGHAVTSGCAEIHNAVNQAADELHHAVATQGEVLRLDRAMITSARALMAELRSGRTRKTEKGKAA